MVKYANLKLQIPKSFEKYLKKMSKKMQKTEQELVIDAIARSIEDFIDLKVVRKALKKKNRRTYTFDEIKAKLGI
jgi:predicted DNA-binding protein